MKKTVCILLALLLLLVCGAESAYDAIDMRDTRENLEALYSFTDMGGGQLLAGDALLMFYDSGRLLGKALAFERLLDAAALTEGSFDAVTAFKQGTHIDRITEELGEGRELIRINISDEDESGVRRVLAWKNAGGEVLEALFELDDNEWLLFALARIAAREE